MGLFSVLYLILLPVVWLPAAMLVVNKCGSDFVLLGTLSVRIGGRQSNSYLCYCRVIRQCKNKDFFFGPLVEAEKGELYRDLELLDTWLQALLGCLRAVVPGTSRCTGLCPKFWLPLWLLQFAQLQHQLSFNSLTVSSALVISHAVIPLVKSSSAS